MITGSMVMLRELAESDVAPLHRVYGNEEATRHRHATQSEMNHRA